MIEYRELERDGKCGICLKQIPKHSGPVRIVHTLIARQPHFCVCNKCAYKIFYAPILEKEKNV